MATTSRGPGGEATDNPFADYVRSPNITVWPGVYERENEAIERDGRLLDAMRREADWTGRTLLDLGCGTGFWLPRYAAHAARVVGVEPEPTLRALATDRVAGRAPAVEVLAGSAEHIPLPGGSVDVVHARFAYFFPPDVQPGLDEVMRVLRPGGTLVVVDNDLTWGEFASLVRRSPAAARQGDHRTTSTWWARRGGRRVAVRGAWAFASPAELRAVLDIELPSELVQQWVTWCPAASGLTYGYALYVTRRALAAVGRHRR